MIDEEGRLKRIDIDGIIYFDSILGIAGTTYPIGTRELPSNTIADVIALCGLHNVRHINVRGVLTLNVAMSAYRFEGYKHLDIAHLVDLGGQDVSVSSFHRLVITGAQAGAGLASYDDCMLLAMTGFNGVATLCGLVTSLSLGGGTATGFINCFSYLGTCTITLGTPNPANFVNLTGSFILAGQTNGVTNIWAANGCEIVINNTCNGGTINIYGSAIITDNSAGGCTVNDYTINEVPALNAATNIQMRDVIGNKTDTALTAYTAADSMMRYIKGLLDLGTPTAVGKSQIAATTIDLNVGAGTYDLFAGTSQAVILESLNIKLPTGAPGGTLASISIQTDDVTPGVIIDVATGDIANLTSEADLGWVGTLYITVATKIQITYVGAAGAAYVCNVTAKYRAVVSGGSLA